MDSVSIGVTSQARLQAYEQLQERLDDVNDATCSRASCKRYEGVKSHYDLKQWLAVFAVVARFVKRQQTQSAVSGIWRSSH
jgi:hypothetical protein